MAIKYATTLELGQALGIVKAVPSWETGANPENESVSTGDNSKTQFFLNRKNIVAGSYTLYADGTAMTEGSAGDYTLDKDSGEITLTTAGKTTLGTKDLTAKYKYFDIDMADSILNASLLRAEVEVDKRLNTTFSDGTATNPTYPLETEIRSSEGFFMDRIIADKKPLKDIETTLNGAHTDSVNTVDVAAGTGANYPLTGTIIINSEAISYTGITTDQLTGCTRGVLGSTAAAHDDGDAVHSTILFRSNTAEGSAVVWTIQPWDLSMNANAEGLLYKFKDADPDPLTRRGVANRVKILYYYGHDSIPADITRLTLIFAKRMLVQDNIGKAIIAGRDEFSPEMFNVDAEEISRIVGSYVILPMGNT